MVEGGSTLSGILDMLPSSPDLADACVIQPVTMIEFDRSMQVSVRLSTWGVCVAESAMEPPSSIPNLVVPHGSAGEYCTGNCVGGEAAAHTSQLL